MTGSCLYIVDGHSQLFRAYYAIRNLSSPSGIPTNAVFGFIQMMNKLVRDESPRHLVVVFDAPGETFRTTIYNDYKANRAPAPPDLEVQREWVMKILDAMNIPHMEVIGVEADDVIGTLATEASKNKTDAIIVSSDKDLFQVIDNHVKVFRQHHEHFKVYDAAAVKEELGIVPAKMVDFIALRGDSSDNIPGVTGIGPKSAAKLLKQFDSIEDLYEHLDAVDNKRWRNLLEEHKKQALLSKRLAAIRTDVELEYPSGKKHFDMDTFKINSKMDTTLYSIYRELGFTSLIDEEQLDDAATDVHYRIITQADELQKVVATLSSTSIVSFDTETTSSNPMEAQLVGLSFSIEAGSGWYIPVGHAQDLFSGEYTQLPKKTVMDAVRPVLESADIKKTAHNAKYDLEILANEGVNVQGLYFDTMVASHLLFPERRNHGLKNIARDYMGISMTPIKQLIGTGKKAITMAQVDIEKAGEYACRDADVTLQLTHYLLEGLRDARLDELFFSNELPLITVLNDMEHRGICIDKAHLHLLSQKFGQQLSGLEQEIFRLAGTEFNVHSPRQVAEVLFEKIGLTPVKSGKTGYSTDISVLEQLSAHHPLPRLLLEYRMFDKLKTTYLDTLPGLVHSRTGKIHTSFNQAVATTGRLISSDPNLQNIPVRTKEGRRIRAAFVPCEPDAVLLAADYSQIELRILAHLSEDEELVNAFKEDRDIHSLTATKIFNCSESEVTSTMRAHAKIINFGIIYGMGAPRLARELNISRKEADDFIKDYFRAYTGVKGWIDSIIERARKTGYVSTLLNRRRFLPDINSQNPAMRRSAERIAINTPVQGTAADLIKRAMLTIHDALQNISGRTAMLLQVHDELIFEVPESELQDVTSLVRKEMEQALTLLVPIKVDIKHGKNWAEC